MRVISVLPSATEIVCALGHGPELVGRSSECDYPPEIRGLPAVMRPRVWDSDKPSREIDERVSASRSRQESLYELDIPLLRSLWPDLLLTQDLCGVCSVTEAEVASACKTAGVEPTIVSLVPTKLSEVWDTVVTVGRALDDHTSGRALADNLRERSRPRPSSGLRVAVVEWLDPPILAGLWTPDIVRAAGGVPIGPGSSEPGRRTSWSSIAAAQPDLVILSPCSFNVERSLRELANPEIASGVESLASSRGIFIADEAYFSRPGPRLASGVELVRDLLDGNGPVAPMPVEMWKPPTEKLRA